MNPAPSTFHQKVSRRIQFQLYVQIEMTNRGEVYNAPVDLQLSEYDIVQPDIVVVLNRPLNIISPTKIKGVPDLVVEILSPSSEHNDRVLKHGLYCQSGVPEYWIVDPVEMVLQQFVLQDRKYQLITQRDQLVRLSMLSDVSVDLSKVW